MPNPTIDKFQIGNTTYDFIDSTARNTADAAVPQTRKVNNKALSADVTLTSDDIGYDSTETYSSGTIGNELTQLSTAITQIEFKKTFTNADCIDGFVAINGDVNASDLWKATDYIYVPIVNGGKLNIKSTLLGNGAIAFYDAYKNPISGINGNNASEYGLVSGTAPVLRSVPVPTNTSFVRICLFITGSYTVANDLYIDGGIGFKEAADTFSSIIPTISNSGTIIENFSENITPQFELGNISITNNGWGYSNSNKRVRTPEGYTIPLRVGDLFKLTDYSNARFYLGWKKPDGTYGSIGWLKRDYYIANDGDYIFLISNNTDTDQTSADALGDLVKITKFNNSDDFCTDDKTIEYSHIFSNENVKSINHRGYNVEAPENTIPAFKLSCKKGFKYVETDIRQTSDGVLVCLHDTTINRTARNADGSTISSTINIADITYEQALTYDFGISKGKQFAGTKIPTFGQFISLCKNLSLTPYIELEFSTTAYIDACIAVVNDYGMINNVVWISGTPDTLNHLKTALPNSRIGYVVNTVTEAVITNALSFKTATNDVFIDSNGITDAEVLLCKNANIPLESWGNGSKANIIAMNPYISGVTSDEYIASKILYENALN